MSILLILTLAFPIIYGVTLRLWKNPNEKFAKIFSFAVVCLTSISVAVLLLSGFEKGMTFIRFSALLSFALKPDGLGRFFAGMIAFLWPFAMLYSFVYMKHEERKVAYFSYYVMTFGVVLGIAFSANALTLYTFYELLTFITLPLITHPQTKQARRAGRMYLYYSLSGSSLALAGIVILTVTTGTNSFVAGGVSTANQSLTLLAYLFTFIGFGVKAAVFPLCRWLPAASVAPTPTTALLHAVAVVKSGAFAIIRVTYCFCKPEILRSSWAQEVCIVLAVLTVVYGSCMSLKEQHFKRRFAFSTVSNLSYILLGALLATPLGLSAALMHFLMHSVTKIGIFFCIGALMETNGVTYVYELNGMGKKAPLTFLFYTVSGLSLIGIPPFCGFISKYFLLKAGLLEGTLSGYLAVGAIILSAVLTAAYVLSVGFRAFVREPSELSAPLVRNAKEPEKGFLLMIGFFAVITLIFGIFGGSVESLISHVVGGML